MKSKKNHKRLRDLGFYLGNSLIGLVFASPLLWMVAASFKPELAIFSNINSIRTFIPEHFSLANYIEVFRRLNIPQILGNTLPGRALPFMMNCFSIYMFYSYFLDIPDELIEAARIDGCGEIRCYFRIVLPLAKTVLATVFILDFVARWNDFMWPFLITTGEDKRTVQLAIQTFFGTQPIHYGSIMAALTLASVPMLLIYIFMQKYYVEGIASTGIKG